jgi:DNA polymerase V
MSDNFTVINGGKNGTSAPAVPDTDERLDLNRYLVRHPAATFFVRVSGASMTGAGINSGDILVLDRVVECGDGDIGVFRIGDELIVRRLNTRDGRTWLVPENPASEPLEIEDVMDFEMWGKVLHVIRTL